MTTPQRSNGIGRDYKARPRTEDAKALRRWINHYRQRRDPPGGNKGAPVGASSEEWQAYVKWVRSYGNDSPRRHGHIAQEGGPDPRLSSQEERVDVWHELDPARAHRLPEVARTIFEAD